VWVASDREGQDDAHLAVTDPNGVLVTQVRRSGVAFSDNSAQFYPGVIDVGVAGPYRIEFTVGSDTMCVTVRYALS
jgi:hypothetical protein